MAACNIAVVGATGAVGKEMLKILADKGYPVSCISLFSSERSAGSKLEYKGEKITVKKLQKDSFYNIDYALFSAGSDVSKDYAPAAVASGTVVIDNSSAFRMNEEIPLVVPEINGELINNEQGIIANPNCSTIQLVLALKPIHDLFGLQRVSVVTYQAVSGSGRRAIKELEKQIKDYEQGRELKAEHYPYPIAFNVLPEIGPYEENGYTEEEMKIIRESKKILSLPELKVNSTAARVPVFIGHCEAVNIELKNDFTLHEIENALNSSPGVKILDKELPIPQMCDDCDDVMVGRIRKDISREKALNLWLTANNLRKGAALNAVQILEELDNGGGK